MYPPPPKHGPLAPQERWFFGIFLVVLLGLFGAEVCYNFQPVKLSALLFVLFWIPLLALHEGAHAIVANLLNWHVGQIVIGMGRIVGSFQIGTASVEIRLFPVEGFVKCIPNDLRLPQFKSALIYFAGPGVELLLAVVILLLVGPDRLLTSSDNYLMIVWQSLALASAVGGVLNLVPHSIATHEGKVPNDGMGIIRSFLMPESHYASLIGLTYNDKSGD